MTEDELEIYVSDAVKTGAQSVREVGKVMKEVMPKVKGRANSKIVNKIVLKLLQ